MLRSSKGALEISWKFLSLMTVTLEPVALDEFRTIVNLRIASTMLCNIW